LFFDTSALSSSATVSAAKLRLYVYNIGGAGKEIRIAEGLQAGEPVVTTDYGALKAASVSGGALNLSSMVDDQYNDIDLNAAGIAWLNAGGVTKLALRGEVDQDNENPVGTYNSYIWFYSPYYTDREPQLIVTYSMQYPSDTLARVSSIRHICRPGFYRMQVGLGDIGFDIDVAEATVRKALDTAKETEEAPPEPSPAKPPEAAPTPPAPEPPTPPSYWGAGPVSEIPGIEEYRERKRREEAAAPEQPSLWSRITPWREEAGETFGGEVMERFESMKKWFGGLFK